MLPTLFIGHGGGPLPLLRHPSHDGLIRSWGPGGVLRDTLHDPAVKAVLVVSAHHESRDRAVEVMTDVQPSLLFDYNGFPPETYAYKMKNPGSPDLSERVLQRLLDAGIPARPQSGRGHDHGVFVPLLGLGIEARPALPIVSVSLRGPAVRHTGLTDDHFGLGAALAALRDEGVLIVGSGNSIHGRCSFEQSKAFDDHLQALAQEGPPALRRWNDHPMAEVCHRRPEHLIPLLVCAGAALESSVQPIQYSAMNEASSHFLFRPA